MKFYSNKFDRSVSLLCWAYNEEDSMNDYLQRAEGLLESTINDYEIVLVDDGSKDRTYEIAKSFQERNPKLKIFRNEKNLNIGISIQRAVQYASKEFLFWQTVDWSYDISNLRVFLEYLKTYDIVQGVRRKPVAVKNKFFKWFLTILRLFGIKHLTKRSDTISKAFISVINYILIRALFRFPLSDFQNVTFYPTKWLQSIVYESNSSFTNPEGLIKAYWNGMSIKEVPISFIPRSKGMAKGTRVKSLEKSLKDIYKLWFKWVILGKRGAIKKGKIYRLIDTKYDCTKILLMIPPTDLARSYGDLKKFANPQPSIGIAYIAALFEKNGFDVKIVDAYVNEYSLEDIIDIIGQYMPDIIGISVLTPSAEVVYEISKNIRKFFPYIIIVMGNMHASLFSEEILAKGYADFIVHGEGELTILDLLKTIENGGNLNEVKGISFIRNTQIINNPLRPHIQDLDNLPVPAWYLLPLRKYATDPRTEVLKGSVEMQILASRGCPNECTFCSSRTERSLGNKYRMRSPISVVNEMAFMYERYGARVFSFMDLAFPLVKRHATDLCNEVINRGLNKKIKWFTECRVKPIDEELFSLMKEAGCVRVCFGIESGDNEILRQLKKNFTTDDVVRAVKIAKEAGIIVDGMFMIGLPNETEETINKTIDFAIALGIRYAIFNMFVPYPGCELYDVLMAQKKIHFNKWSDFTSYPSYGGGSPVYAPDALTKDQLIQLQSKAMKKFYLRPRFILNEFKDLKMHKVRYYLSGLKGLFS